MGNERNPLSEKLFSSINRTRLSEFLKRSIELKAGCFYFALLASWEHLNPHSVLSRNIDKRILSIGEDLGVKPDQIIERIGQLQEELNLCVVKIGITSFAKQGIDEVREMCKVPPEIEIFKYTGFKYRPLDEESTGVIDWQSEDGEAGHFTSLFESNIFGDEGKGDINSGGQRCADAVIDKGYIPVLVFHLKKC